MKTVLRLIRLSVPGPFPLCPSAFAAFLLISPAQATIRYTVSLAQPEQHLFRIGMTVPDVKDDLVVQLPAWNATYQIRDFAHHIQNVHARDASGSSLPVVKVDKQTWRIRGQGNLTVEYASFWDEPGPFSSQLNPNHAFINFATILFYVPSRRAEDVRVEFRDLQPTWAIGVALRAGETSSTVLASSYDALVDAPVEISAFQQFRFEIHGPERSFSVRVIAHGDVGKQEELTDKLRKIVTTSTDTMRDAPFTEFLFLYHFGEAAGGAGGGMEHASSTAINSASAATAEGVSAHEFFHLWNVKRIRPRSLEPVVYTRENWTRALWFAEGVTSTYGSYVLVRSGLWSRQKFYEDLARQISFLESRPAHSWQSVEQSSLDAWLEKYPLYRRPEFSVSYYNKGQILGLLLDIFIRDASDNRAGLDDVMRELNQNFARRGRFYDETVDLAATIERVAGRSAKEFFRRFVSGTDELPCQQMLSLAGLRLLAAAPAPAAGYRIEEDEAASDKQRRIREGILTGSTDH